MDRVIIYRKFEKLIEILKVIDKGDTNYEIEYLEELDQMIKWKGEIECYIPTQEQIPIGIPPSHWWWYLNN